MGYYRGNVTPTVFLATQFLNITKTAAKADRVNALEVNIKQHDSVVLTGGLRAAYFVVSAGLAACNEMKAIEAKVRAEGANIAHARVIAISLDAKKKVIALGRGIEISVDASAGGGITTVEALRIANNSSGAHTKLSAVVLTGIWNAHLSFGTTQALGGAVEGDFWYDAGTHLFKFHNGTAVQTITSGT